jgi:hypothetical protein
MKFKLKLNGRWKSLSIYTKNKQTIIRYWGGFKFDIVKLSAA